MITYLIVLHADSEFPSYHSVAILKMHRFDGKQVKSWLNLNFNQVHQVFEIVKAFHKVNTEAQFNLCNSHLIQILL